MKKQVADYKRFSSLVQNGDYYRIFSPFDTKDFAAWNYVSEDKSEALVTFVCMHWQCRPTIYLKVKGLDPNKTYVDENSGLGMIAAREAMLSGLYGSISYSWIDSFNCLHVELKP
jgi:alpha-galactosidase